MKIRIASIAIATVCALLAASPARAQDESLKQAREYFDKAQTLFEAKTYDKAAEFFEKAYQARNFPQFLFNIGVCHEKSQNYQLAIDYYNRYLAENPSASDKEALNKRIEVLKEEIKRIEEAKKNAPPPDPNNPPDPDNPDANNANQTPPEPSEKVRNLANMKVRGLVVIESEPQDATIYLDSKKKQALGKTPWSGSLEGQHKVFIERKGYKPRETTIFPSSEKFGVYWFGLKEEDYLGWIEIKSNVPGADIYIDDKSSGVFQKTPYAGNIKPGKHTIWVTKVGYDEFKQEIEIIRGQTHEVSATLKGSEVGYLNVRGPGIEFTKVMMDGKVLCERGPCRMPVQEGTHTVEFKRKDHKPYKRTVVVQKKTETTVTARLAKEPGRADAITAYVLSAVFLGGGIYAGLKSNSIKDDLDADLAAANPPLASNDERAGWTPFKGGKFFSVTATVAYSLSGITLATALYYTFRDKGAPSSGSSDVKALALEPTISPDFSGVSLGGRF